MTTTTYIVSTILCTPHYNLTGRIPAGPENYSETFLSPSILLHRWSPKAEVKKQCSVSPGSFGWNMKLPFAPSPPLFSLYGVLRRQNPIYLESWMQDQFHLWLPSPSPLTFLVQKTHKCARQHWCPGFQKCFRTFERGKEEGTTFHIPQFLGFWIS